MKKKTIIIVAIIILLIILGFSAWLFFFAGPSIPAGQGIDEASAKQIVLQQTGLTENDVTMLRTSLEMDDGRWEYEVKFFVGTQEYSYQVDAATGTIIDADVDSIFD